MMRGRDYETISWSILQIDSCLHGLFGSLGAAALGEPASEDAKLLQGAQVIWDMSKAYRETTPTRERICINGLWHWQPASNAADKVPTDGWGYFKVPGCWPGITDYMQKDSQTIHAHPSWRDQKLGDITAAWYEREITIPTHWAGRHIVACIEYLNSYAVVYVDGRRAGETRFPGAVVKQGRIFKNFRSSFRSDKR